MSAPKMSATDSTWNRQRKAYREMVAAEERLQLRRVGL